MGKHCQTSSLFSLHEPSTPVWEVVEVSALEWHTAAGNLLWETICEDCGLLTWTHSVLLIWHVGLGFKKHSGLEQMLASVTHKITVMTDCEGLSSASLSPSYLRAVILR